MNQSNYEKIVEFHNCSGLPVHDHKAGLYDTALVKLRLDLITEEFDELQEAVQQQDYTEIIDALADLLYVTYGACASFGIIPDDKSEFRVCHQPRFQPQPYITQENPNLVTLNLSILHTNIQNLALELKLIQDNLSSMDSWSLDTHNLSSTLFDLLRNIYMTAIAFGVDINKAFALVHVSNMTKFCNTEQEAIESVKAYENDIRYDSPAYKKCDNTTTQELITSPNKYVIYNKSSGKILKSLYYKPVSFISLLENQSRSRSRSRSRPRSRSRSRQ